MTDPVTALTASAIASLAFQEFVKSGAGDLAKRFTGEAIAQEINAGKLLDQSSMTQNNYDNARGWQTKVDGGTAYIGEIHIDDQNK
jgi:hypothetical protein